MNIIDLHPKVWLALNERCAQLPHALLLAGQRGVGKFELAEHFAQMLLCENRQNHPTLPHAQIACGHCPACVWLAQGNHPDFRQLQPTALGGEEEENPKSEPADASRKKKPSQQITIDQVRGLDDFLHIGTHRHGARVILVNPAEAMNRATANALLKSLEEPMVGTLFILVTSEVERLLPTIRSRCQSVFVPPPRADFAQAWLTQAGIAKADEAARWLELAGGSPLLAVQLAKEPALLDVLLAEFTRGTSLDPLAAAAAIDKVIKAEKGATPLKRMIEWSQKWLFDLTLESAGLAPRYFCAQALVLKRLAAASSATALLAFSRKTLQYKQQCEQPVNSRLFLEAYFLDYAALF